MNKRSVFRGLAIGAAMLALTGSVSAFASAGQRTLTAEFSDIKIVLDGKALDPKDANGNPVEPFTVDGTTYLPVRAITEALGKDVRWDGDTSTVTITSPADAAPATQSSERAPKSGQTKLSELDYLATNRTGSATQWATASEMRMNTGDFTQDVLYASFNNYYYDGDTTTDYLLNSQYKRMSGSLFLSYDSRDPGSAQRFIVWGDGVQIYTSPDVEGGFLPISFDIDISGVKVLRIGFEFDYGSNVNRIIGISNTVLTR